ncbi:potassium channel subfamily T member 2-like isoform X5 [Mytilus edulis]|uniref:potassium channel subfamily T member 2-like isoform X5 n=1 Tax=Mytilus edulis TaxID=6550 RepID=UPI0039F0F7EB
MSNPWIYHHKYSNEQNMNNRRRRSPHRNSGVLKLSATSDNIPPPPKVRVEFFTNEKSLKEKLQLYFIKNQRSSLRIRIFNLLIKLLSCVLYLVRVGFDTVEICNDNESASANVSSPCHRLIDPSEFRHNPVINWNHILFVNRDDVLWAVQVSVACISLAETILVQYLSYKGNILQQIISVEFILELINTVPFFVTMVSPELRNLFIPVFFNCWLAKSALQNMFNDLHRVMMKAHSALAQQLMILCATILCLVFTSVCGIQHLQRGGNQQFNLVDSIWFVVVTFSTVGYGDIYPDIWISQMYMIIMIGAALIVLPTQIENLGYTWLERQKQGGAYSSHRAQTEKHVVVVATTLQSDTIMDFLHEFYAHPALQSYFVVLLSPCELDPTMKMLLQVPIWSQRVIYIQGSAVKDTDLIRCRVQDALACFILAARNYVDKGAADQHTILRSWAIKDFAPDCPQYVQIFRPENKFHVKFAEHVVCEDEFKYALLANNCLCAATSTLVTLLIHTSRGQEGQTSSEEWQQLYGERSGNEIYSIKLEDSTKFFREYEGKSFTYASFHAHRRFGVSLVGVQQDLPDATIQLNPGPRHIMKKSDICFYMNITKEENTQTFHVNHSVEDISAKADTISLPGGTKQASKVASVVGPSKDMKKNQSTSQSSPADLARVPSRRLHLDLPKGLTSRNLQKRPSIAPVPAMLEANDIRLQLCSSDVESDEEEDFVFADEEKETDRFPDYIRGFPPVTPYIGTSPTLCHLMEEKREFCCLRLNKTCEHCSYSNANEYNWHNRTIILAADNASNGIYNFIVPLRSHARPKSAINPIVLLLEKDPASTFLETICHFPMVYWMKGSIECLEDLLEAGINLADNVVVVNKETSNSKEDEFLADCNTIVAVQTIFRLFPSANIITELSQSSNMRFMQFRPNDQYSFTLAKLEKKEKSRGSNLSYMFRIPFAAGNVFSASMLDTILYQAFVKPYVITFTRLLLGVDQAVGSGHLSVMKIKKEDLWIRTYGRLYQKFCSTTCEIPIAIYRTQLQSSGEKTPSSTFAGRDQSALNLAFRNSVKRRRPEPSKSQPEVSLSLIGLDSDEEGSRSHMTPERHEICQMVRCRMQSLKQPLNDYDAASDKRNTISYVIINPSYDLRLKEDDIIYLIKPSSLSPQPSPLIDERKKMQSQPREEPTGADNCDIETTSPVISTDSRTDGDTPGADSSHGNCKPIPVVFVGDSEDETYSPTTNSVPHFHLGSAKDQAVYRKQKGSVPELYNNHEEFSYKKPLVSKKSAPELRTPNSAGLKGTVV